MPPHETPRLTFSGLQTIVSYNCLKCNRISSFRGDAKHRTRNLEIPRCAIAHLWSGPSDHPGMTCKPQNKDAPVAGGVLLSACVRAQSFLRKPENFFWNRETRPPRSMICWAPPVQAGCDFGSISRLSLSPALPQVDRVWYSVPSVITTVIV